jgi:5-(carboxyamino)imidazole ribonucleotide synthase
MIVLAPGARIGILGGGQLGRMLATAGAELGFDIHVFSPEADSPAGRVAAVSKVGSFDDDDALAEFAAGVDAVTFEFENIPVSALAACARYAPIRPGTWALELTQDRLIEKDFVQSLGLSPAPYRAVSSRSELDVALNALGLPAILKTRRMGYDGKGQALIRDRSEADAAFAALGGAEAVLEGFVDFAREASVILARGAEGDVVAFAVTQNSHRAGILRESIAPAPIADSVAREAVAGAAVIALALEHIGVLAVEYFIMPDGGLRVNEIAPRVHNSGHWTQDVGGVSQFTQHMRAVAGWPLSLPSPPASPVRMINLIGEDATNWRDWAEQPTARLHLYGKHEARPGRKMGHVTLVAAAKPTK